MAFNWGDFFPPRGHLAMLGDMFGCHNLDGECVWYVVGRGQGCYYEFHPHRRVCDNKIIRSKMSIVLRLRNPAVKILRNKAGGGGSYVNLTAYL